MGVGAWLAGWLGGSPLLEARLAGQMFCLLWVLQNGTCCPLPLPLLTPLPACLPAAGGKEDEVAKVALKRYQRVSPSGEACTTH